MPVTGEFQNEQSFEQPQEEESRKSFQNLFSILSRPFKSRKRQSQLQENYSQTSPVQYGNVQKAISSMGAITTPFMGSTRSEAQHPGIDIANKIGTPIMSFAPGVVKEVVSGKRKGDKAYGNYVVVEDPYGIKHRYSHLAQSYVKVGEKVGRGENIGAMGATGNVYSLTGGTGSHLDYRISNAAGRYLNPYSYLSRFF